MYLNRFSILEIVQPCGLTITWDVFEFKEWLEKYEKDTRLTITWDVFEFSPLCKYLP